MFVCVYSCCSGRNTRLPFNVDDDDDDDEDRPAWHYVRPFDEHA
jgi:hypothetical protein